MVSQRGSTVIKFLSVYMFFFLNSIVLAGAFVPIRTAFYIKKAQAKCAVICVDCCLAFHRRKRSFVSFTITSFMIHKIMPKAVFTLEDDQQKDIRPIKSHSDKRENALFPSRTSRWPNSNDTNFQNCVPSKTTFLSYHMAARCLASSMKIKIKIVLVKLTF